MTQEPPTALPWTVERYGDGDSLVIHAGSATRVCFMATPGSLGDILKIEANAALIVRAVNLHADLVLALDQYKSDMLHSPQNDSRERRIAMIDKLLARAKGAATWRT